MLDRFKCSTCLSVNIEVFAAPDRGEHFPHLSLDTTHEQQYDDYEQDDAKAAAWAKAPSPAVRPAWNRTDQQQDKYDEKNGTNGHVGSPWVGEAGFASPCLLLPTRLQDRGCFHPPYVLCQTQHTFPA